MEILFEILLDLLSEGVTEASLSKKVPKPVRYIAIVLVVLFFAAVLGLILFMGAVLLKEKPAAGWVVLLFGLTMAALSIAKFKKVYPDRQGEETETTSDTEADEETEE